MKTFDKYAYLDSVESARTKASYLKTLEKYNVWTTIANIDLKVTCVSEKYRKDGRKTFPTTPTEAEVIDHWTTEQYLNCITSIPFFRDRVEKGYTPYGYVPIKLTSYSPDGNEKWVRRFTFTE